MRERKPCTLGCFRTGGSSICVRRSSGDSQFFSPLLARLRVCVQRRLQYGPPTESPAYSTVCARGISFLCQASIWRFNQVFPPLARFELFACRRLQFVYDQIDHTCQISHLRQRRVCGFGNTAHLFSIGTLLLADPAEMNGYYHKKEPYIQGCSPSSESPSALRRSLGNFFISSRLWRGLRFLCADACSSCTTRLITCVGSPICARSGCASCLLIQLISLTSGYSTQTPAEWAVTRKSLTYRAVYIQRISIRIRAFVGQFFHSSRLGRFETLRAAACRTLYDETERALWNPCSPGDISTFKWPVRPSVRTRLNHERPADSVVLVPPTLLVLQLGIRNPPPQQLVRT